MKTLIFGGAFDPPHNEHVRILFSAAKELSANRIVVVPTYNPPHKSGSVLSFETRLKLIRAAFGEDVIIDEIERERNGLNYSSDILPILKEKYGDIVYLIGGDSLAHLPTWHEPKKVTSVCPIAVVRRSGYDDIEEQIKNVQSKLCGEFILLNAVGQSVSSTEIKTKLLLQENADEIPDKVLSVIKTERLFNDYATVIDKLKTYESHELFVHSKEVVKEAVKLNSFHNLRCDYNKVFLAALLHDNAKERPSLDGLAVPENAIGTSVLHQFLGALKAERDFGVKDTYVLNAIKYHTTAKPDMTTFEKLIYTADSVSGDRDYYPIPDIRKIAETDFNAGFLAVLEYTYDKLIKKGITIYPLTLDACKFYLNI